MCHKEVGSLQLLLVALCSSTVDYCHACTRMHKSTHARTYIQNVRAYRVHNYKQRSTEARTKPFTRTHKHSKCMFEKINAFTYHYNYTRAHPYRYERTHVRRHEHTHAHFFFLTLARMQVRNYKCKRSKRDLKHFTRSKTRMR